MSSLIAFYPDDDDGNALRKALDDGSDMSKPMFIFFYVAMPSEKVAKRLAALARKLGYRASVYDSDGRLPWTCECSTRMLATYLGVIAIQKELDVLSKPLGGFSDGWGTFGNGASGQLDYSKVGI